MGEDEAIQTLDLRVLRTKRRWTVLPVQYLKVLLVPFFFLKRSHTAEVCFSHVLNKVFFKRVNDGRPVFDPAVEFAKMKSLRSFKTLFQRHQDRPPEDNHEQQG